MHPQFLVFSVVGRQVRTPPIEDEAIGTVPGLYHLWWLLTSSVPGNGQLLGHFSPMILLNPLFFVNVALRCTDPRLPGVVFIDRHQAVISGYDIMKQTK